MSRYARAATAAWAARGWLTWLTLGDLGLAALLRHHPKAWLILAAIAAGMWLIRQALGRYYTRMYLMEEYRYNMSGFKMRATSAQINHIRRTR